MDLERIKQQLRLRSGRTKKPQKQTKSQTPATAGTEAQTEKARPPTSVGPRPSTSRGHAKSHVSPTPASSTNAQNGEARSSIGMNQSNGQAVPPNTSRTDTPTRDTQSPLSGEGEDRNGHLESNAGAESNTVLSGGVRDHEMESNDQQAREEASESQETDASVTSEADDFDLRPPAPRPKAPSVESMSELLFSSGHLDTLLYKPSFLRKFTAFLQRYRPQDYPLLTRYLEVSKALRAVEYANAVAENASALPQPTKGNETETSNVAAVFDTSFKESCASAYETLLNTSLPLYITFVLIRTISECLTDEITGRITPLMRNMVGGLSEVFCLTDPKQEDNPIIYASEEFYRLTGYGQDSVIGHNCRFLQGPKTNRASPKRIRESLDQGETICETLLNYRRDGKPFMNLLMVAPLHDGKGNVKYHIGAQVDVSGLVETGRILDGFQYYLGKREADKKRELKEASEDDDSEGVKKKRVLEKLRELSELFDLEESAVIQSRNRSTSEERDDDVRSIGSGNARRRFIDSEASDSDDDDRDSTVDQADWKLGQEGPLGLSGKLPGIYEKYMLIRPAPSLRIVFVSPKLQKFGSVVQSPFLSRVAAPNNTLSGLLESFKVGAPVSARINFMPQRSENRHGTKIPSNAKHEDGKYGRACWISATPLLGGDGRIGVWMIVFVEKAQARAQQRRSKQPQVASVQNQQSEIPSQMEAMNGSVEQQNLRSQGLRQKLEARTARDDGKSKNLPIKPRRLDEAIDFTAHTQDSQRSTAAHQYRAATPVEEYHSAGEAEKSTPPQALKDTTTNDEDFVKPASLETPRPSQDRIRIGSDSEEESGYEPTSLQSNQDDSNPGVHEGDEAEDPNGIPPSIPSDHEQTLDEDESSFDTSTLARSTTPERNQTFGRESSETVRQGKNVSSLSSPRSPSPIKEERDYQDTPTSAKSHNSRNNTTLPAGLGYMDYLRHPSRHVSGDAQRGRQDSRPGNGSEECLSPYSVD